MPRVASSALLGSGPEGHDLVGRRVTVRRRLDHRDGRPRYSDVVGVLVAADDRALVVRRAGGDEVRVAPADVHRLHPVPVSTAQMLALEEAAALGWQPPDTRWLGRWLLRAAGGWTGRANSVLPLGDPGLPLDRALAEVAGWYAERGLPAQVQVPLPARAALDAALAGRGWTAYHPSQLLTAEIATVLAAAGPAAGAAAVGGRSVTLADAPDAEWLAGYHHRGDRLPAGATAVLTGARRPVFATVRDGAEVVAVGRAAADAGWAGVTALEVAPAHRRRGLAVALMAALASWAAEQSVHRMYLQVADDNAAALGLYRRLGFGRHHRYQYRLAPAEAGSPPNP